MTLSADDEILQDFLVEAGEILEQLSEQLVDLEQQPEDYDLLNAVFRGFHTIKGGAGFLNITPLVEVTHRAEDVFNILRQGQRKVTPELMDPVLQVLDLVNEMFALVNQGEISEEEAMDHPHSNILMGCLGTENEPPVDIHVVPRLAPGDALMSCSDGVWHYFTPEELASTISMLSPREACEFLIQKARARAKGMGDNLSLTIVKLEPLG